MKKLLVGFSLVAAMVALAVPIQLLVDSDSSDVLVPDNFWTNNRSRILISLNLNESLNGGDPNGPGAPIHFSQLFGIPDSILYPTNGGSGGGGTNFISSVSLDFDVTSGNLTFTNATGTGAVVRASALSPYLQSAVAAGLYQPLSSWLTLLAGSDGGALTNLQASSLVGTIELARLPSTVATDSEVAAGYQPLNAALTTLASGDGNALTNLNSAALTGTIDDARIPSGITRDAEAAAAYQPLDSDLTALASNNGGNLTNLQSSSLTGTIDDARIPAGVARDSEVAAAYQPLSANLTALASNNGGSVTNLQAANIVGTLDDARIPSGVARDAEVAAAYQPLDADLTALANNNGGSLTNVQATNIVGTLDDARIPSGVARDAEVAAAYQPLSSALTALAQNNGGAVTNLQATNLVGTISDSNIPSGVARDSEVASAYQPLSANLTTLAANDGSNLTVPTAADISSNTVPASTAFVKRAIALSGGGGGGSYTPPVPQTNTWSGFTLLTDASVSTIWRVRLTNDSQATLAVPTNAYDGQTVRWEVQQDSTGNRSLTLGTGWRYGTDITGITLSTNSFSVDYLMGAFNASSNYWDIIAFSRGYR